jgi:hypothetical protein
MNPEPRSERVTGRHQVVRVRETLRSLIDLSDLSRRAIEKRLAAEGRGIDMSRLLAGRFDLKLHQMLDILRVLDFHPVELFVLVFDQPVRPSPLLERAQELFGLDRARTVARPPAATAPLPGPQPQTMARDVEELRRRVDQLARAVAQLTSRLK